MKSKWQVMFMDGSTLVVDAFAMTNDDGTMLLWSDTGRQIPALIVPKGNWRYLQLVK